MAAPPEDSGGVFGYARLVAALGDGEHPEHAWAIEWSEPIDAQNVDEDRCDARLAAFVAGEYFEGDLDFEEFKADGAIPGELLSPRGWDPRNS